MQHNVGSWGKSGSGKRTLDMTRLTHHVILPSSAVAYYSLDERHWTKPRPPTAASAWRQQPAGHTDNARAHADDTIKIDRRAALRFIVEVEVAERLPGGCTLHCKNAVISCWRPPIIAGWPAAASAVE